MADAYYPTVRRMFLQTIDLLWVDHLEAMEYLRSSVNLRAYGQRDPLVEYKKEGLRLFQGMEEAYRSRVLELVSSMGMTPLSVAPGQARGDALQKIATSITTKGASVQGAGYSRNDQVTITNGTETQTLKYKKAEPLIETGVWHIV
jgi:preprotein translocase subunit SecA